jgi:hypothetical protein
MTRPTSLIHAAAGLLLAGCVIAPPPGGPAGPASSPPAAVVVPPPVTVTPTFVVVQGTPVAYASNWPEDLFLYEGRYYRVYRGHWYWAATLGSGWTYVSVGQVPRVVVEVQPRYRPHGKRKGKPRKHYDD